jgi:hypothetical protein
MINHKQQQQQSTAAKFTQLNHKQQQQQSTAAAVGKVQQQQNTIHHIPAYCFCHTVIQ